MFVRKTSDLKYDRWNVMLAIEPHRYSLGWYEVAFGIFKPTRVYEFDHSTIKKERGFLLNFLIWLPFARAEE